MVVGHIPIPAENKWILLPYKDALLDLASPNVPYKTKKRVLVQEGSGFIEDVLALIVSSFEVTHRYVEHSKRSLSLVLIKMKRKIDLVEEEHESEHEVLVMKAARMKN